MKLILHVIGIFSFFFFLTSFSQLSAQHTLRIEITNCDVDNGTIYLAIFKGADGFPNQNEKSYRIVKATVKNKKAVIVFKNLAAATYAYSLYHDENANGKIDYNFLGIPKEGYAFSTNFKPKLSTPSFEDADFKVTGNLTHRIKIIN